MSEKFDDHSSLAIAEAEFQSRVDKLWEHLQTEKLSGVVLFDNFYILYFTGFAFIPTERPMAFIMNSSGEKALFVPRLEVEHAQANAFVQSVFSYSEYPGQVHPMQVLVKVLSDMGINGTLGMDQDGYPWVLGYRGPRLSDIPGLHTTTITPFIEDLMMVKSPVEVMLIKESVRWGHLAHSLLQRYTQVGSTETEVSQRASMEANLAMLATIGEHYKAQSPFSSGVEAGYRGQIGRQAAIPHSLARNITFQAGDVLVSGAGVPVWGYNSELERTMLIGKATNEQKTYFTHMLKLQETAFEAIKPGRLCSQVDQAVHTYYDSHGLMPYWKHHSGHSIGLRYHESPFLDTGDDTQITPGMVFTVEPGLYVPGLGGFRHSDTVVVTESGIDLLTNYPRDLESLTIPL